MEAHPEPFQPMDLPIKPGAVSEASAQLTASASCHTIQHICELENFLQNDFVEPNI